MLKENSMNILGNKLFRVSFFAFLLGGIFLFKVPNSKAVGDANFPDNTTLQITVGSTLTNYTIGGGSNADSLVVNPSSFVITISAGQRFTVYSSDRHTFTNDSGYSTICPSSDSSSLDVSVTTTQKVVTVTPSAAACSTSNSGGGSSGGGGGSGGGVSSPTVSATQSPLPSPTPTTTPLPSTLTPSTAPVLSTFTRDLRFGMSGDDVKALQDYLRTLGFYSNPNSTGFFDTPTKKAVIAWQKKNKLLARGYFGPYSRAKYNQNQTPLTQKANQKKILSLKSGVNFLNIRVSPSIRSKIVSKLKADQQVNFVDTKNGWYKIQNSDGSFGWVSGRYVDIK